MSKIHPVYNESGVLTGYKLNNFEIMKYQIKHRNNKTPATVSLLTMCKNSNHPEYFLQIRNRILRDSEIRKGIYFDLRDTTDLFLSSKKLYDCLAILVSYFERSDILAVIDYLDGTYPNQI